MVEEGFLPMLLVAVVNAGVIYKAFHNPKYFDTNKFRLSLAHVACGYERQFCMTRELF